MVNSCVHQQALNYAFDLEKAFYACRFVARHAGHSDLMFKGKDVSSQAGTIVPPQGAESSLVARRFLFGRADPRMVGLKPPFSPSYRS